MNFPDFDVFFLVCKRILPDQKGFILRYQHEPFSRFISILAEFYKHQPLLKLIDFPKRFNQLDFILCEISINWWAKEPIL